jgi:Bacterial regulatory proteins, crp family
MALPASPSVHQRRDALNAERYPKAVRERHARQMRGEPWWNDLEPNGQRVARHYVRNYNGPDGMFPSQARVAKALGLTRETVNRQLGKIVAAGGFERGRRFRRGRRTSNAYYLRVTTGVTSRVTTGVTAEKVRTFSNQRDGGRLVARETPRRLHSRPDHVSEPGPASPGEEVPLPPVVPPPQHAAGLKRQLDEADDAYRHASDEERDEALARVKALASELLALEPIAA